MMEKGKLIPIVISILLFIVAVGIFINNKSKSDHFKELIVTYNSNTETYNNLKDNDIIKIGNTNFYIVSIQTNKVVLNTSSLLLVNNKEVSEYEIGLNNTTTICFKENDCASLTLK